MTHYQYLGWPDHGVPAECTDFLKLLGILQDYVGTSPIIVHCSAGVGRTGVLVATHLVLQRWRKWEKNGMPPGFLCPCVMLF